MRVSAIIALLATWLCSATGHSAVSNKDDPQLRLVLQESMLFLGEPPQCTSKTEKAARAELSRRYGQIGDMMALFATSSEMSEIQRETIIANAIVAYERAFDCSPDYEHRHHLLNAIALIAGRLEALQPLDAEDPKNPKNPEDPEDAEIARQQREALISRQNALGAKIPGPPPVPTCPTCSCPKCKPPKPPPSGYAGLHAGRYSARVEGGTTVALNLHEGMDEYGPSNGAGSFGLALGVRFTPGAKKLHVLEGGARFSLTHFKAKRKSTGSTSVSPQIDGEGVTIIGLDTYFRYGIRAHPKYLSLHGELGLGSKGNFQVSLAGLLCSLGESLCLNVRHFRDPPPSSSRFDTDGLTIAFSIDMLRIYEFAASRR